MRITSIQATPVAVPFTSDEVWGGLGRPGGGAGGEGGGAGAAGARGGPAPGPPRPTI
jgi:hypothetical protein